MQKSAVGSVVIPIAGSDQKPAQSVRTTCPYCGVGCGVVADTAAQGTVSVTGDPGHPANFGRLCSKGSDLAQTLSEYGRLRHPAMNGKNANWDDALDLIAEKFTSAIKDHGPDSVAFYVSGQLLTEDYYVANKLMKGFIGSANIDTNSRLCMASSVAGHRRAFGADTVPGCYDDIELADLVVLTGSNLAWCHPVLFQRLQAARSSRPDMRLVVIDPRRTVTAQAADLHLAIKPDSDCALFAGLLAHLLGNNCIDQNYIEDFTAGFDDAVSNVAGFDLPRVSELTGVDSDSLQQFYQWFAGTDKTVTIYSQGVNQSVRGTDKVNAIINCHLATGRIGKPGSGPFSVTGQPNAMGGREVGGLANMLACHMDIENEQHRNLVRDFWQSPTIATKPGLKAVDLFEQVACGKIKALWVMATNPVDSLPAANAVKTALKNCPFLVVSDVSDCTDTLQYADVSLPALAWGEKDGTVTNSERLISRQRCFQSATGEAKADWWALSQVAARMGFSEHFNYRKPAEIFREYAALSAFGNNGSRDFDIGAFKDITDSDYDALAPFYWPYASASPSASSPASQSASQSAGQSDILATDSREGAVSVGGAERRGDVAAAGRLLHKRFFAQGGFFHHDKRARFVVTAADEGSCLANSAYPYRLNTGRIRDQWHTMTRTGYSARLAAHIAEPFVEIHPADAEALSISTADLVCVSSEIGEIVVRALLTDRVQRGEVFVPMHWTDQFASSARVDCLIPPTVDPVSGQPASKNIAVALRRKQAGAFGFFVSAAAYKPDIQTDYWAIAPCEGGWRVEFALEQWPEDPHAVVSGLVPEMPEIADQQELVYCDAHNKRYRQLIFSQGRLLRACFFADEPVQVARSWMVSQLQEDFDETEKRHLLAAGIAGGEQPDIGAIVCSCFSVGVNQIINAAQQSACCTVDSIGAETSAGTNCGSCRGEIEQLLNDLKSPLTGVDIAV